MRLCRDCYLPSRLGNGFILLHRTAAALVDAAHGSEPQLAAGEQPPPGSPEGRVQGLALLFSHLVGLMQVGRALRVLVWLKGGRWLSAQDWPSAGLIEACQCDSCLQMAIVPLMLALMYE